MWKKADPYITPGNAKVMVLYKGRINGEYHHWSYDKTMGHHWFITDTTKRKASEDRIKADSLKRLVFAHEYIIAF